MARLRSSVRTRARSLESRGDSAVGAQPSGGVFPHLSGAPASYHVTIWPPGPDASRWLLGVLTAWPQRPGDSLDPYRGLGGGN